MSLFAAALRVTGLSHVEASVYLSDATGTAVSEQTVKNMASGRSNVGDHVLTALRELYALQVRASEQALDQIAELQAIHGEAMEIDLEGYGRSGEWPSERVAENARAMVWLAL